MVGDTGARLTRLHPATRVNGSGRGINGGSLMLSGGKNGALLVHVPLEAVSSRSSLQQLQAEMTEYLKTMNKWSPDFHSPTPTGARCPSNTFPSPFVRLPKEIRAAITAYLPEPKQRGSRDPGRCFDIW